MIPALLTALSLVGTLERIVLASAALAAVLYLGKKGWEATKALRAWWVEFAEWRQDVRRAVQLAELQMTPNNGSTMLDKVNRTVKKVEVIEGFMVDSKADRAAIHRQLDGLVSRIDELLDHDDERDVVGKRYGGSNGGSNEDGKSLPGAMSQDATESSESLDDPSAQ